MGPKVHFIRFFLSGINHLHINELTPGSVIIKALKCFSLVSSHCRFEYLFNFDNTFEIHDDIEVLKRMGMAYGLEKGQCSSQDLEKARTMVPKALEQYVIGKCLGVNRTGMA